MTAKTTYEKFTKLFPYLEPDAIRYQTNHKDGGIDIMMNNGTIFNFKIEGRNKWLLRRVE